MTAEEMQWEFECAQRLAGSPSKRAGTLVTTKSGLIGRTYSHEKPIKGKIRVYTDKGNLLCSPGTLTVNGFID
ncbi:hypothetical protein [Robiginitalea biformata]|uniref:hypothetical protein n=1 Tax=Robiginitalea biformata TaxID=252307 RepID=UPI000322D828|nr:hypothetical protein [Robiginitalea biformata]